MMDEKPKGPWATIQIRRSMQTQELLRECVALADPLPTGFPRPAYLVVHEALTAYRDTLAKTQGG